MEKSFYVLIFLILLFPFSFADAGEDNILNIVSKDVNEETLEKPIVKLRTFNDRFLPGSVIIIDGKIFDSDLKPAEAKVAIGVYKVTDSNKTQNPVFYQTFKSDLGKFRYDSLDIRDEGKYLINATVFVGEKSESVWLPIEVKEFRSTGVGIGIYAEIFFVSALLALIYIQLRHGWSIPTVEPLRFALLTLCSVVPIIIFLGADVQLGQDSPFGFLIKDSEIKVDETVLRQLENPSEFRIEGEESFAERLEWVINVGGTARDKFQTGIQIPVFVLIFGLIGGYLRFLRKTSKGWLKDAIKDSLRIFEGNGKKSGKCAGELLANQYYITTPSGELFEPNTKEKTCHICNRRKDFIQMKGENICAECFRKRSKSCDYCKIKENSRIKKLELELIPIDSKISEKKERILEIDQILKRNETSTEEQGKKNSEQITKIEIEKKKLEYEIVNLLEQRKPKKIELEDLYVARTTEISRDGHCQNQLDDGTICKKLNLDNKHKVQRWKNKSKLQKRFFPEVKRAIFNNSMEDLALIFLPPVLAFALYFVLLQAGINARDDMPTIAAVSLAVGLVTKEALGKLEAAGRGLIPSAKEPKTEPEEGESKDKTKLSASKTNV